MGFVCFLCLLLNIRRDYSTDVLLLWGYFWKGMANPTTHVCSEDPALDRFLSISLLWFSPPLPSLSFPPSLSSLPCSGCQCYCCCCNPALFLALLISKDHIVFAMLQSKTPRPTAFWTFCDTSHSLLIQHTARIT